MKVTTRLTLVVAALLLLLVAGSIVFQKAIYKQSNKLALEKKNEIANSIDLLLSQENANDKPSAVSYDFDGKNIYQVFVYEQYKNEMRTKKIDSSFCSWLNKNINSKKVEILFPNSADFKKDSFRIDNSILTFLYPLFNEKNQSVGYLKISVEMPMFAAFSEFLKKYNVFFIAFTLAILALLMLAITSYINMPLNGIFNAMKTGQEKYLENMEKRTDEFGQLSRLIALSFNQKKRLTEEVEERKKHEDELQKLVKELELTSDEKEKAKRADQAKTEFISNISHELRTPMNAVVSISSMLSIEKLDDKQSNLVKVLNFSARQLTTLVSDILDFSKIEDGTLELDEEPFNLFALCNEIVQMHAFKANDNGLKVYFDEDPQLKKFVIGDPHRMNQVLVNLFSNAVKFTEKGEIRFSYKIIEQTENTVSIKFTVQDTGIGIAQKDLDRIFERFNQANSEIHKKYGGSGLGLTLSKKLVELMGGKLEVVSEVNKGSVFFFTLQLPLSKPIEIEKENKLKEATGTLEGLKVLVAEDHEINSFVLKQFFKQWHVEAVFAENGKIALDELVKSDFDVVLMDLQMPVMDGVEAVKRIRNHPDPKYKKIAIIALTANAAKETRDYVLRNGFDLFISKPFDPANLHQILYNVKKYYVQSKPDVSNM
jgi:signal transduction histidine kinase/ActR/RegA family two-component response regulator